MSGDAGNTLKDIPILNTAFVYGFTGLPAGDPRANITMVSSPTTELHEAGIKGNFLDGSLTVSVDAFRMTHSGSVLFSIIDNTNFISKTS